MIATIACQWISTTRQLLAKKAAPNQRTAVLTKTGKIVSVCLNDRLGSFFYSVTLAYRRLASDFFDFDMAGGYDSKAGKGL